MPVETSSSDQSLSSDATNGGTPGFFFLAPLGTPPPVFPGTFDGTLKPRLSIVIHDVDCNNNGIVGGLVQTYNTVFVYPAVQQYKVNHNVSAALYTAGQCYRVIPRLDGVALGFADVAALPNTQTAVPPPGYVKWGIGANRAIVFRLENMDPDADGVPSNIDNCDDDPNPDQADADLDGIGDVCDQPDSDGDGVDDSIDNCIDDPNADQADGDLDGVGTVCDNCPGTANPDQADGDLDGTGDACEANCAPVAGATGHWAGNGNSEDGIGVADGVNVGTVAFGAGRFGQAFAFGGAGFVRADAFDQVGAFSVSLWAKADILQGVNNGLLSSSQGNVATSDTFQIDWNSTKGYRLKLGGNTAPTLNVNIGAAVTTAFQHIVVTYDGTTGLVVYLDGVQTGTGSWVGPQLQFSSLKIGTNRAENLRYRGSIDDVTVFSRAITALEVADIFAQPNGVCPPT